MKVYVAVVAVMAFSTVVSASPETVVVASSDDSFRAALDDALVPTGIRVIATTDEAPSVAALSVTARRIADREGATSTVWLIFATDKTTLVTYDRDVDRVLVREVPFRAPLTPAQAAETARMARTMLRALRVTPEVDLPLPHVEEARAERAKRAELPVASVPRTSDLAVAVAASVRVGGPATDAAFDGRLSLLWRPDGLGLGLHVAFAPHADLQSPQFMGTVSDDSLAVTVDRPIMSAPSLRVVAMAGIALHVVSVDGGAQLRSATDVDPALRFGVIASYEATRSLDIGIGMSVDGLLQRQRYVSGVAEVFVMPRIQLTTGLVVTLRVL